MEERITITINKKLWKKLSKLKLDKELRSFDEVIKYLLLKKKRLQREII